MNWEGVLIPDIEGVLIPDIPVKDSVFTHNVKQGQPCVFLSSP